MKPLELCLFVIAFCIAFQIQAQKIYFSDTTNKWKVYNIYNPTPDVHHSSPDRYYQYYGSTDYKGYKYKLLVGKYGYAGIDTIMVREDTADRKVYGIIKFATYGAPDTVETVMYDYGLKLGDTFRHRRCFYNKDSFAYHYDTFTHYVKAIDSIMLRGTWHKVFTLYGVRHKKFSSVLVPNYRVIEGLGSTEGLLTPLKSSASDDGTIQFTFCFETGGSIPSFNKKFETLYYPWYEFDNSCYVAVQQIEKELSMVGVYPNPSNGQVRFVLPYKYEEGVISIIDIVGKTVYAGVFDNADNITLDLNGISKGVYFYTISDAQGASQHKGQIVFQ